VGGPDRIWSIRAAAVKPCAWKRAGTSSAQLGSTAAGSNGSQPVRFELGATTAWFRLIGWKACQLEDGYRIYRRLAALRAEIGMEKPNEDFRGQNLEITEDRSQ
jgi:hypothetical protein